MLAARITHSSVPYQIVWRKSTLCSSFTQIKARSRLLRFSASSQQVIHEEVNTKQGDIENTKSESLRGKKGSRSAPWSIQSLAELNGFKLSTEDAGNNQSQKGGIRPDTALILVNDVSLRLAQQHRKCDAMLNQLEHGRSVGSLDSNLPSTTEEASASGPKKVIRAANSFNISVSFKDQQAMSNEAKQLELKARKLLSDLRAVHRDTLQLTRDILESKHMFERFSEADRATVAAVMEQIRSRHATTVEMLADIAVDLRRKSTVKKRLLLSQQSRGKCQFISESMVTRFLEDRLGVQLLCDHYLGFHKGRPYGGISANIPIKDVISDAVTEMTHLCDANHGWCPPVELHSALGDVTHSEEASDLSRGISEDLKATLIRPWIHHALGELLKNAMEATVQQLNKSFTSHVVPLEERVDHVVPIVVHVDIEFDEGTMKQQQQNAKLAIHVVDHGTGFGSREGKDRAFVFAETGFSGHDKRWDRLQDQQSYAAVRSPLSSLGVGLPLSRMMMRLFGGDLILRENQEIISGARSTVQKVMQDEVRGCTATITIPLDLTIYETTWNPGNND